jgi:signal peptide peptidase SppA
MTETKRDRAILDFLTASGWALEPTVLARLSSIVLRHAAGERLSAPDIEAVIAEKRSRSGADERAYRVEDGTAVIPISGLIAKHAWQVNDVSQPRGVAVEDLHGMLDEALADDAVERIFLHIESPGGTVDGMADLGDAIWAANREKPVVAFADASAQSGAYWLGSQAGLFLADQGARLGSIGVYTLVLDDSRRMANEGLQFHLVRSGPNKGIGEIGQVVTPGNLAVLQDAVGDWYEQFLSAVLRGRAHANLTREALLAVADGRTLIAPRALEAGLIDGIASPKEALAAARGGRAAFSSSRTAAAVRQEDRVMADKKPQSEIAPAAVADIKALREAFPLDPARALAAVERGLSVEAAKAEAFDTLGPIHAKQLADLRTAHAETLAAKDAALAEKETALAAARERVTGLEKLVGSKGMPPAGIPAPEASDAQSPEAAKTAGEDDGKAETYAARVEALVKAGRTRSDAHLAAAAALPKAFEAWTDAQQPKK